MHKNLSHYSGKVYNKAVPALLVFPFALGTSSCGAVQSVSTASAQPLSAAALAAVTEDDRPRDLVRILIPVTGAYHPGR